MRHWVPFDERRLTVRLGLRPRDLEAYLYDDHRALASLAAARGLGVAQLTDELVAPWRPYVAAERYALLRDRTERLLTQPHLAQHVFFHLFHGSMHPAPFVFGLPADAVMQLRLEGRTPLEIATLGGVSGASVQASLLGFFRTEQDEGERLGFSWPPEADRIFARQAAALDCWIHRPRPGGDPTNPYGKARFWHGPHARDWPSTARQRRANERRVERLRRRLKHGCWRLPTAWSWRAHGLAPP